MPPRKRKSSHQALEKQVAAKRQGRVQPADVPASTTPELETTLSDPANSMDKKLAKSWLFTMPKLCRKSLQKIYHADRAMEDYNTKVILSFPIKWVKFFLGRITKEPFHLNHYVHDIWFIPLLQDIANISAKTQNLTRVVIYYEIYETSQRLVS